MRRIKDLNSFNDYIHLQGSGTFPSATIRCKPRLENIPGGSLTATAFRITRTCQIWFQLSSLTPNSFPSSNTVKPGEQNGHPLLIFALWTSGCDTLLPSVAARLVLTAECGMFEPWEHWGTPDLSEQNTSGGAVDGSLRRIPPELGAIIEWFFMLSFADAPLN